MKELPTPPQSLVGAKVAVLRRYGHAVYTVKGFAVGAGRIIVRSERDGGYNGKPTVPNFRDLLRQHGVPEEELEVYYHG